jgi:predicted AlkP superfamily pyrophosphatase or phosphodiesterase
MNSFLISIILTLSIISSGITTPLDMKNEKRTPTLIISFSGLRADRLDEFLNINTVSYLKKKIVDVGVKAKYMEPSFPTNIFPNMFSMITGKYSENHGVIGDKFYDFSNKRLLLLSPARYDLNTKYWTKSQPFWLSDEAKDVKVGSSFWIGSEILGREPDMFLNFDKNYTFDSRADDIVNWFKKFQLELGLLSFTEPYETGIKYGPDSEEYLRKIEELDQQLGLLMSKFDQSGLLDLINIIIVGDVGMATFKDTILFKDFVSESLINFNVSSYDVVSNIRPINDSSVSSLIIFEVKFKHEF